MKLSVVKISSRVITKLGAQSQKWGRNYITWYNVEPPLPCTFQKRSFKVILFFYLSEQMSTPQLCEILDSAYFVFELHTFPFILHIGAYNILFGLHT